MSDHMPNLDSYLDPDRHARLDEPEPPEPAIDVTIDWPGESLHQRCRQWSEVFGILGRFVHIRQSRLLVSCFDEDEDTYVRLEYRPNRQEIAFHAGRHEFADEREAETCGWRD